MSCPGRDGGGGSGGPKEFPDLCDELFELHPNVFHAVLARLRKHLGKRYFLTLYRQQDQYSAAMDLVLWAEGANARMQALRQALAEAVAALVSEQDADTRVEQRQIWSLPPISSDFLFVGRHDTRERITQALLGDGRGGEHSHAQSPTQMRAQLRGTVRVVVLFGLGGVGKTMLAARYAFDHAEQYGILWWINAESSTSAETGLAQLGERLGVCSGHEEAHTAAVSALRDLASRRTMWLLVFDNADDPGVLKDLIPTSAMMSGKGKGHVLVTSRVQGDVTLNLHLPIGVFDEAESVELLRELTVPQPVSASELSALAGIRISDESSADAGEEDDRGDDSGVFDVEGARKLAKLVENLPLALAQAGSYVAQTMISLSQYTEEYKTQWLELMKDSVHNVGPGDYEKTVLTTWEVTMEKVKEKNSDALELLRFCSLIAADDIPQRLLVRFIANISSQNMDSAKLAARRAIAVLRKYSLIHGNGKFRTVAAAQGRGGGGKAVEAEDLHIHRVLQAVVRAGVINAKGECENEKSTARSRAILTLDRALRAVQQDFAFSRNDWKTWAPALRIAVHGKELVRHARNWIIFNAAAHLSDADLTGGSIFRRLLRSVLRAAETTFWVLFEARGDYWSAKSTALAQLDIARAELGEDDPAVAASYDNLGIVYRRIGRPAEAAEFHEKALKIRKSVQGEDHILVAMSYNNVGLAYDEMGERAKAAEFHEKALKIRKSALGEDNPAVATSYSNLGLAYRRMGEVAKAAEFHEKALKIRKSVLGEDHPGVATSYDNVGVAYREMGEVAKAAEFHENALKIRKNVLGEDHPAVATSYSNLGLAYRRMGEVAKAAEFHEKALKIRKNVLGEDHPNVATSYSNAGAAYHEMEEHAKAATFLRKAVAIFEEQLGRAHKNTETAQKWLSLATAKCAGEG